MVLKIDVSASNVCALDVNAALWCWGGTSPPFGPVTLALSAYGIVRIEDVPCVWSYDGAILCSSAVAIPPAAQGVVSADGATFITSQGKLWLQGAEVPQVSEWFVPTRASNLCFFDAGSHLICPAIRYGSPNFANGWHDWGVQMDADVVSDALYVLRNSDGSITYQFDSSGAVTLQNQGVKGTCAAVCGNGSGTASQICSYRGGDCLDGILNGDETDSDCGGSVCAARCLTGMTCDSDADCSTNHCFEGQCIIGGAGSACRLPADCESRVCRGGTPTSSVRAVDYVNPTDSWLSISGLNADSAKTTTPVPIGFQVPFFDAVYSTFDLTSNGWMGLGANRLTSGTASLVLPSVSASNAVAIFAQDSGSVSAKFRYAVHGHEPFRQIVIDITGNQTNWSSLTPTYNAQVALSESTGIVSVTCNPCAAYGTQVATQGVADQTGTISSWLAGRNKQLFSATDTVDFDTLAGRTCSAATVSDGVQNGSETGIDCGGGSGPLCGAGQGCLLDGDCRSANCIGGVCAVGVAGSRCEDWSDCASQSCLNSTCAASRSGNILVEKTLNVGSFSNYGSAISLQEFSPSGGTAIETVNFPTAVASPNRRLIDAGLATGHGYFGANGGVIAVLGYDAPTTTANLPTALGVKRVAAVFDGSLSLDASARLDFGTSSVFASSSLRSIVPINSASGYIASTSTGVVYYQGSAITVIVPGAYRVLGLSGGQLVASTNISPPGIYGIGSGLPVAASTSSLIIPTSASPNGFALFDDNGDGAPELAYVCDDGTALNGGGLQRYSLRAGVWSKDWSLRMTPSNLELTTTGTYGCRSLVAENVAGGKVVFFVEASGTNNRVLMVNDEGVMPTTAQPIAIAGSSSAFRGIQFRSF